MTDEILTHISTQIRLWQECRNTSPLLCHMDPDHPPMEWVGGYFRCVEETCGYIRYDPVGRQVLDMVHREHHHGCYLPGGET